jgi:hypothetical protein
VGSDVEGITVIKGYSIIMLAGAGIEKRAGYESAPGVF